MNKNRKQMLENVIELEKILIQLDSNKDLLLIENIIITIRNMIKDLDNEYNTILFYIHDIKVFEKLNKI